MSDPKKADKISVEELHFIETLKKEFNMLNLKVENTKLQYENALFKIMRKYGLSESDSIDENTGAIVRRTPPSLPMAAPPAPPAPPSAPVIEQVSESVTEAEVSAKSKRGKNSK